MVLNIKPDGSNEDALAQAVAQHRSTFPAGLDLQYAREWCDTMPQPEPAEACTELGAEPEHNVRPAMEMLVGALCGLALSAALVLAFWPADHPAPKQQPKAVSLGVWA